MIERSRAAVESWMSRRFFLIVNPSAASGRAGPRWATLRSRIEESGAALTFAHTTHGGHAIVLAREAADHFDVIVAVGGDGTVSEVANGVVEAGGQTPIAILPLGTANDTAAQFGMRSADDALTALLRGVPRTFDTIEVRHGEPGAVQTRHALMFVAAGFSAELLRRTTARIKRLFGPCLCYGVGFLLALWRFRQHQFKVRAEQEEFNGSLFHVCAGNTEYAGGHLMRLSPGALADDGLLDLCVIKRISRFEALWHAPMLIRGTHPTYSKVRYFRGTSLEVLSEPSTPLAIDGDLIGSTPASLRVCPQSLAVLVPHSRFEA